MPRKFSSKVLTLVLLTCSFSAFAFESQTGLPSFLQTKDQIRLALWYEGVNVQSEASALENRLPQDLKTRSLPVELSHPLENWNI